MAITVELGIGQIITVQHDSATIGQDPASDICIPNSPKIQPVHARIVKVANKWMIQSEGDWLLQVGDGVPGRNSGSIRATWCIFPNPGLTWFSSPSRPKPRECHWLSQCHPPLCHWLSQCHPPLAQRRPRVKQPKPSQKNLRFPRSFSPSSEAPPKNRKNPNPPEKSTKKTKSGKKSSATGWKINKNNI